jgi:hypothetical protein
VYHYLLDNPAHGIRNHGPYITRDVGRKCCLFAGLLAEKETRIFEVKRSSHFGEMHISYTVIYLNHLVFIDLSFKQHRYRVTRNLENLKKYHCKSWFSIFLLTGFSELVLRTHSNKLKSIVRYVSVLKCIAM